MSANESLDPPTAVVQADAAAPLGAPRPAPEPDASPARGEPWTARLPRPVRAVAHAWWKLFSFLFAGNFLASLAFALVQGGTRSFVSAATSWGLLAPIERAHPPAFWAGAGALALLAVAGFAEERAEQRAGRLHAAEQERRITRAQATAEQALAAATVRAEPHPPQPLGPPDDVDQLGAPVHFVGREADLAWVEQRLRAGGASAITALRGLGGIGKTTLAAEAVRRLQAEGRFPDGVGVVLCQGLADPAEALRRVLIRFDPLRRAPEASELARLQDLARAALRDKRALVVLDSVEPELAVAEVVAPLRAAGVTLLLTARQALPAQAVPADASRALDLLVPEEALELFAVALGRGGANALTPAERTAAEQVVGELGRHTLAVKLAGAYAAAERRDLGTLARELGDPTRGLALPADDATPQGVRRTLALSLDTLPTEARRLFAGLAAFATPEFGRQAALELGRALGQRPDESLHLLLVRALVDPSTNAALPEGADRERLRLHPLLRALAAELLGAWPTAEQDAAVLAVARHLARYAELHQNDYGVLAADEANLVGALEWAHAHDHLELVAGLAHGLRRYWDARGRVREAVQYLAWGTAAAEAAGMSRGSPSVRREQAELDLAYGWALYYSGQVSAVTVVLRRSLEAFQAIGDRKGEGAALSALGEMVLYLGQYETGERYLRQSLTIAREVDDRQGEGAALAGLGQVMRVLGQHEMAASHLEQSLAIAREVGDHTVEGVALTALGQVAMMRGRYEAAERYEEQALALDREGGGDRQGEGVDLLVLGDVALRRGQNEVAQGSVEQALAIFREIGDRGSEGAALTLLGQVALRRGKVQDADSLLEQGAAIARETGILRDEARSIRALGHLAAARDDAVRAEALYRQTLAVAAESGLGPEVADAQFALGQLLAEQPDRREEACSLLLEAARRFAEMDMPEAEEARAAAERLGCAEDPA